MKPSWDDSPEWAKFLAMDADGNWCWFEVEPEYYDYEQRWILPFDAEEDTRFEEVVSIEKRNARGTLEARP